MGRLHLSCRYRSNMAGHTQPRWPDRLVHPIKSTTPTSNRRREQTAKFEARLILEDLKGMSRSMQLPFRCRKSTRFRCIEYARKVIAAELVSQVRQSVTIDWTLRESARAKVKVMVKRILRKHGYPRTCRKKRPRPCCFRPRRSVPSGPPDICEWSETAPRIASTLCTDAHDLCPAPRGATPR
jgi:hypothetical protein